MKKIDLGQSIGILANIGVLIGILLLAYELNQNRDMMQSQVRNSISEALTDLIMAQATDPLVLDMEVKRAAGERLTPQEELMFRLTEFSFWRHRENVYYQHQKGLFEESEYVAQRAVWLENLNTDAMARDVWCSRENRTVSEFWSDINSRMSEPCE